MAKDRHEEQRPPSRAPNPVSSTISRRGFLKGIGTGAITAAVAPAVLMTQPDTADAQTLPGITQAQITLKVNGKPYKVDVESRTTLLSVLREKLDLTGAKLVCDRGECGGCTVLMDGKPVYACMMLALDAQGHEITTIEGLAAGDRLHPIQEAFIEHDALMCGFCTPGFVVAIKGLLDKTPNPTLDDIKRGVSGNICRCGTYPRVFQAALTAAQKMRKGG
ncbi:MAG: (2Fe-2S)-binding protein [Candidatus Latescibacteria bacterium]|nr:(2Fe-2S)-binding protein [Candidatus Latescibacterota bacterium]